MKISKNIKCEIAYDGTLFHGYQIQPSMRTVQGELQKALYKVTKKNIQVIASGRTDAGVHARKQVCNFNNESDLTDNKWAIALNSILPEDIRVLNSIEVEENFHARYDVRKKVYRYYIYTGKIKDVFRRNYTWHYPYPLDLEQMVKASSYFLGEHDFTSFSSVKTDIEDKIRTIYESTISIESNEIIFQVAGNGFLYNMVRILMGTLIDVGKGKIKAEDIENIIKDKDRGLAGNTAPANGLILWDVFY